MGRGKIILLNGVSSSGKSSLAKELVKKLPDYFHLSIDDYDYIIEKMENREEGRLIPVSTELFFHETIKMFSDNGVNLIVEQILHNQETIESFYEILKDYPILFVGVHCPVDELDKREVERGDRLVGLAKEQLTYVHQQNEVYDICIDTHKQSLEECATLIVNVLDNQELPKDLLRSFRHLKNKNED